MIVPLEPVLWAIAACLAAGVCLLALLSLLPATAASARTLWPTLVTEFVILGTASLAFAAGGTVLLSFMLVLAARVAYEAAAIFAQSPGGGASFPLATAGTSFALALGAALVGLETTALAAVFLLPLLLAAKMLRILPSRLAEIVLFPILPAVVLAGAAWHPGTSGFLLLLFVLIESFDSYALLGGKLFGRHKVFPRLSPNKTAEGIVVGALALALTAAVLGAWLLDVPAAVSVPFALAVGVLAVAGDLAASRLKREAGVKDFPTVLPRQGGLLDIADAWLLAGAVLVVQLVLAGPPQ